MSSEPTPSSADQEFLKAVNSFRFTPDVKDTLSPIYRNMRPTMAFYESQKSRDWDNWSVMWNVDPRMWGRYVRLQDGLDWRFKVSGP